MGLIIGPTTWWANELAAACPVGTTLPDGSRVFCKAGGTAWIVAPCGTQVGSQWVGGIYNGLDAPGTDVCCICDWTLLCTTLISCGFNPCDWFVPSFSQLTSGYNCRANWDFCTSTNAYWSSTEVSTLCACSLRFQDGTSPNDGKLATRCVRAFRCVTY